MNFSVDVIIFCKRSFLANEEIAIMNIYGITFQLSSSLVIYTLN